jgi:putative transposase
MKEELPCNWLDCRLVLRDGQYYLCVPHATTTHKAENQGRVVGLDPGVRTFLTWFSENSCGKIGSGASSRIFRLALCLDKLCGKTAKAKGVQRARLKKAQARLRWKIRNLIDEMHWKAARFLCLNFDVILLPTFEVSEMVCRLSRKIKSKTVRKMLTLAHFKFKQRLKFKAFELGKIVLDCDEAYTSKTASWTGEIKENLGGAKSITSNGITVDRDENGARGIVLRALGDQPWFGKVLPKPAFVGVVTNVNKK